MHIFQGAVNPIFFKQCKRVRFLKENENSIFGGLNFWIFLKNFQSPEFFKYEC